MNKKPFKESLRKFILEETGQGSIDEQTARNKRLELQNKSEEQKQEMQREFGGWAKRIVSLWLYFIVFLLVVVGAVSFFYGTQIFSDKVLITLLAATTVKVLGMVIIVIKYLFANKQAPPRRPVRTR